MEFPGVFVRDGQQIVPTELARGPWNPNALHGGPVAGLFAALVEQHVDGDLPPFVARITVELLRPVPLAPLIATVTTRRPGRSVAWVDAHLTDASGVEVATARALRVHRVDTLLPVGDRAQPFVDPIPHPESVAPHPIGIEGRVGFWSAIDFRLVRGDWIDPGPGAAWFRLRYPLIAGETTSPFARVCAAADFGSGVGNPVRQSSTSAINPEITVHVHRELRGGWVGLESIAWAHGEGMGLCESRIFDETGPIGRAVQALLVRGFNPFPNPGSSASASAPQ
jgi:Thioesterase-like superfamily